MKCPFCDNVDTRVIDSRPTEEGHAIRRRRGCDKCGKRFTTYEKIEESIIRIIKRDGRRESFDRNRLAERQITLRTDDDAVNFIADAGYDPVYGARPLKRYLVRNVETKLARALIAGDVRDGATVTIGVRDGALIFAFA